MCGFVGYITCVTDDSCLGAGAAISAEHQQKALDTLEYRGPDAEGQWQDQHAWLGHRRFVNRRHQQAWQPADGIWQPRHCL